MPVAISWFMSQLEINSKQQLRSSANQVWDVKVRLDFSLAGKTSFDSIMALLKKNQEL